MLFKNGREIKIPTEAEQGINTYLWYNYLFICFSFNKLFRQYHSFFISAVSRKTFVRLSKTSSAKKNVYMFLDIRPLRFEAKEQAGIKMGAGPFESGPYPQRPQAFIRFLWYFTGDHLTLRWVKWGIIGVTFLFSENNTMTWRDSIQDLSIHSPSR